MSNRQVDWDGIPDTKDLLPAGDILFKIEDITEGVSKSTNKAMVIANLRALEPSRVAGLGFTVRFVIGSDKDPKSDDPNTIKSVFGGILLKKMLKKAGVRMASSFDKTAKAAEGAEVIIDVTVKPNPSERNPDAKQNDTAGFYSKGERQPKLREEALAAPAPAISGADDDD